jgi:hypothetical protein
MNIKRISIVTIMIFLGLLASACGSLEISIENTGESNDQQSPNTELITPEPPIEVVQPTTPTEEPSTTSTTKRYTFEQLGISLEIPKDLYVKKDPIVNYEDQGKLDSYLFYIQNYGYPGDPSSGNFQMYGHLQYNLLPISWDEFSNNQINSEMNSYANYIEVGGLRGYDTQVAGIRNRFVYHFYLEGSVLTIAVADPTPENKTLSDQIIQSLEFIPGGFSDTSHVKLVRDPNQLYQILIPDDWELSFQPTIGVQLSSLEATSSDFEVIVDDEVEGPHSNIYYKQGIFLHVQVIEDDSAGPITDWSNQWQYVVYFNGIEGTVYVYKEPSTAEGELRTVKLIYEGKTYILRFGYADDADLETIDRIISSFNITPETFYPPQ